MRTVGCRHGLVHVEESRFHRMECTTTPIIVETEHKLIFLSELFMLPRCFTQNLSGVTKALGFLGSPLTTELAFLFLETLAHIASTIVLELFCVPSLFQQVDKAFKDKSRM